MPASSGTAGASDGVRFVGEDRRTAQRFTEAAEHEQTGRWDAAVDLYLSILNDAGADLVPTDASATRWLPARWIVHRRIAASSELLSRYRERTDGPARKLLDAGEANRNSKLLEQLVATMFCARPTERAIDLLGDLACERGDFGAAQSYWAYLAPGRGSDALAYPRPDGDPALRRAKIIVARMLAGDSVADDLAAFAEHHANATGALAGENGKLVDILTDLARSDRLRVPALAVNADPVARRLPDFKSTPPFDPISLPEAAPELPIRFTQRPLVRDSALAFLPTIAAGHALLADARRVTAFNLATGQLASQFDARAAGIALPTIDTRLPSNSDIRYSVLVAGDRVYVRFGQQRIRADRADGLSTIAALRFRPEKAESWQLLWTLPAPAPDRASLPVFDGAPAIADGRLICASTRIEGNRAITAVACFDPADTGPLPLWQRDVLDAPADSADRTWHVAMTTSNGRIVLGPLAGAIVALETATGHAAWAVRSPLVKRSFVEPPPPRTGRDCLAVNGMVYAFLDEAERIVAVDSASGSLVWTSEFIDAVHLVGAANGKLIVQTGGLESGLAALDTQTGRRLPDWGYSVFGADAAAPFGRGLIVGDRVCWPTRNAGVRIARLDGSPEFIPTVLRSLPGGNLIFGEGVLLVATAERLLGVAAESDLSTPAPVQSRNNRSKTTGSSHDRGAMR